MKFWFQSQPLQALSESPTKTHVVVASQKDVLQILSVNSNEIRETINLRMGVNRFTTFVITDLKWAPGYSSNTIATATQNGSIAIWDLAKVGPHKLERTLAEHTRAINSICFNKNIPILLLSASHDGTMKLWDLRTKRIAQKTFDGKSEVVREVNFNPLNSNHFVAAFDNGTIQKWDLRNQNYCINKWGAHNGPVLTAAYSEDGKTVASGGRDKIIKIWDFNNDNTNTNNNGNSNGNNDKKPITSFQTTAAINHVSWRPDYPMQLASSSLTNDFRIHIWDLRRSYIPRKQLYVHNGIVTGFLWKDENTIWSCSKDKSFASNDITKIGIEPFNNLNTSTACFSPTGELFFAIDERRSGQINDLNSSILYDLTNNIKSEPNTPIISNSTLANKGNDTVKRQSNKDNNENNNQVDKISSTNNKVDDISDNLMFKNKLDKNLDNVNNIELIDNNLDSFKEDIIKKVKNQSEEEEEDEEEEEEDEEEEEEEEIEDEDEEEINIEDKVNGNEERNVYINKIDSKKLKNNKSKDLLNNGNNYNNNKHQLHNDSSDIDSSNEELDFIGIERSYSNVTDSSINSQEDNLSNKVSNDSSNSKTKIKKINELKNLKSSLKEDIQVNKPQLLINIKDNKNDNKDKDSLIIGTYNVSNSKYSGYNVYLENNNEKYYININNQKRYIDKNNINIINSNSNKNLSMRKLLNEHKYILSQQIGIIDTQTFDSYIFIILAKNYKLDSGDKFIESCNHNSLVANAVGYQKAASTWRILAFILSNYEYFRATSKEIKTMGYLDSNSLINEWEYNYSNYSNRVKNIMKEFPVYSIFQKYSLDNFDKFDDKKENDNSIIDMNNNNKSKLRDEITKLSIKNKTTNKDKKSLCKYKRLCKIHGKHHYNPNKEEEEEEENQNSKRESIVHNENENKIKQNLSEDSTSSFDEFLNEYSEEDSSDNGYKNSHSLKFLNKYGNLTKSSKKNKIIRKKNINSDDTDLSSELTTLSYQKSNKDLINNSNEIGNNSSSDDIPSLLDEDEEDEESITSNFNDDMNTGNENNDCSYCSTCFNSDNEEEDYKEITSILNERIKRNHRKKYNKNAINNKDYLNEEKDYDGDDNEDLEEIDEKSEFNEEKENDGIEIEENDISLNNKEDYEEDEDEDEDEEEEGEGEGEEMEIGIKIDKSNLEKRINRYKKKSKNKSQDKLEQDIEKNKELYIPWFDPLSLIGQIMEYYSNEGDVQMCATIISVCLKYIKNKSNKDLYEFLLNKSEQWIEGYVNILYRLEQWDSATKMINYTKDISTTCIKLQEFSFISSNYDKKKEDVNDITNNNDNNINNNNNNINNNNDNNHNHKPKIVSPKCVICHKRVNELFSWCSTCLHGGHLKCINFWNSKRSICPSGCGHLCSI